MTRRWSLARRITLYFALITPGLVAAISVASAVFLRRAVERELDGVTVEELGEMRAIHVGRRVSADTLAESMHHLAADHPGIRMAWRVSLPDGSEVLGEWGAVELLSRRDLGRTETGATRTPDKGLRWRGELIPITAWDASGDPRNLDGVLVELLIDGRERLEILRRYGVVALALILIAALVAVAGGALFGARLARTLRQVAELARSARATGEAVAVRGAPEEIRAVAEAFDETLGRIHADEERARLLIAGLAHELRSPLQNLLGETEVLLLRERSPDEYRQTLEDHADELRDVARVVDNLVTLCAARDGKGAARESFDLGEEVALRLERQRARAERRGVRLVVRSAGDLRLAGDREALLLVVQNLIGNAVDWSPPDGSVEVRLEGDEERVQITVDDAGGGVPEGERGRIFEPFYRGPRRDGQRVGYGLGLALSRTAVEAHGGSIAVGDSPLGGARFQVRIPTGVGAPGRARESIHDRVPG